MVVNILLKGEWAIRSEWECEPVMFSFKSSAMYISQRFGYNQGTVEYYLSSACNDDKWRFLFSPWCHE